VGEGWGEGIVRPKSRLERKLPPIVGGAPTLPIKQEDLDASKSAGSDSVPQNRVRGVLSKAFGVFGKAPGHSELGLRNEKITPPAPPIKGVGLSLQAVGVN
jgi:hypothetical protein